MHNVENIINLPQYTLLKKEKINITLPNYINLIEFHKNNCWQYYRILEKLYNNKKINNISDIPYIPVSLFKNYELSSINSDFRKMTSSGTTSSNPSKIILDQYTSFLQKKALSSIISSIIGKNRLPILFIDSEDIIKNKRNFSARTAGILGFFNFGKDHFFALDSEMNIKKNELVDWLNKYKDDSFLIFGFTFIIWEYFYKCINDLNLNNGILIHGGGWKKLQDKYITNEVFKKEFYKKFNLKNIHNFYGMVEQTGNIHLECKNGFLHTPNFADIIIRDPITWKENDFEKEGIVQVLSLLPKSYPGNSLLTEDIGVIIGEDDCSCGWKGKYFKINGRLKEAELRGCSDTYQKGKNK